MLKHRELEQQQNSSIPNTITATAKDSLTKIIILSGFHFSPSIQSIFVNSYSTPHITIVIIEKAPAIIVKANPNFEMQFLLQQLLHIVIKLFFCFYNVIYICVLYNVIIRIQ
jgi:hypothetical protein